MKHFLNKLFVFILLIPLAYEIKPIYLLISEKYKEIIPGREIYLSLKKSKQKNKSKKLLIGDSVGNQLFNNETNNDTINSLACNQAISMAGHYILLNNYINAGNTIDTLYMIFTPFFFKNNLDQVYTYHYFLKPFFNNTYKKEMTATVINQINKVPYKFLINEPSVLTSAWAPDFTSEDTINYTFLSPISVEYLGKIKALSEHYHFKIILLPTPICVKTENWVKAFNKKEITKNGFESLFDGYFEKIIYLDESFFCDRTHLKNSDIFTKVYKAKWVK